MDVKQEIKTVKQTKPVYMYNMVGMKIPSYTTVSIANLSAPLASSSFHIHINISITLELHTYNIHHLDEYLLPVSKLLQNHDQI